LGNIEEGLLTGDFEGWMKGFLFPPLGDSMEGASWRAPLLENLKDEVFEGYTCGRAFLYIEALLETLKEVRMSGLLRKMNSISEYLLNLEVIQVLNLSEAFSLTQTNKYGFLLFGPTR
jgi:hypothetical protein